MKCDHKGIFYDNVYYWKWRIYGDVVFWLMCKRFDKKFNTKSEHPSYYREDYNTIYGFHIKNTCNIRNRWDNPPNREMFLEKFRRSQYNSKLEELLS